METEGRALASVRLRLAAIAAAHRLGGHEDPTTRPLVKATMKRLAREYGKLQEASQGADQRGSGRGEGHGADPAGRPRKALAQGDRGQACSSGPGPPGGLWQSGPMRR